MSISDRSWELILGIRRKIANRHMANVALAFEPYLEPGEVYGYRALGFWVRSSSGERQARMYAYITSRRLLVVSDDPRGDVLVSRQLRDLVAISVRGLGFALAFADDETHASVTGLEFPTGYVAREWLPRLLEAYEYATGRPFPEEDIE